MQDVDLALVTEMLGLERKAAAALQNVVMLPEEYSSTKYIEVKENLSGCRTPLEMSIELAQLKEQSGPPRKADPTTGKQDNGGKDKSRVRANSFKVTVRRGRRLRRGPIPVYGPGTPGSGPARRLRRDN